MGGWLVFIWGIPAALGALVFLKLVANSVALVEADLIRLTANEQRAFQKRRKQLAEEKALAQSEEDESS